MDAADVQSLINEIVARTEAAIELASHRVQSETLYWRHDCYRQLAANLATYRNAVLEGRLGTPGNGLGWGAGKAISEWGLDDAEISAVVEAAEGLYRDGW